MSQNLQDLVKKIQEFGGEGNTKQLRNAYSGKTKAAATHVRSLLSEITNLAKEVRKEVLAVRKGEIEPTEIDIAACCDNDDCVN